MNKRFPFTKRTIESSPSHDPESPSREAEDSDAVLLFFDVIDSLKLIFSKSLLTFAFHT
jgi:hypothetical protein